MTDYLLDTHAMLWWLSDDPSLPITARKTIAQPQSLVFVSMVSLWEIAIKVSIGKLNDPGDLRSILKQSNFELLDIAFSHVATFKTLPLHHRDPFDRMLIAQAFTENIALISNETVFGAYGVNRLWE